MRERQSKRGKRQTKTRHHWTLHQNRGYLLYLKQHQESFKDFKTKKATKVFVNLAQQIKSRSVAQVKSHHQKMMAKHGSIPNIILFLAEQQEVFGIEGFSENDPNSPLNFITLSSMEEGNQVDLGQEGLACVQVDEAYQLTTGDLGNKASSQVEESQIILAGESEHYDRVASIFYQMMN